MDVNSETSSKYARCDSAFAFPAIQNSEQTLDSSSGSISDHLLLRTLRSPSPCPLNYRRKTSSPVAPSPICYPGTPGLLGRKLSKPLLRRKISSPTAPRRKISSPSSGKILDISNEDLRNIQIGWLQVANKQAWSSQILQTVFKHKPDLRRLFRITEADIATGKYSSSFIRHCNRFATFFDQIITWLSQNTPEAEQCMITHIRALGRTHANTRYVSFDASNWLIFKYSILEGTCGGKDLFSPVYQSWNRLVMFVIAEMKDAFYSHVRQKASNEPTAQDNNKSKSASAGLIEVVEFEFCRKTAIFEL